MVKYEFQWEMDEWDDPELDAPMELHEFKGAIEGVYQFIKHPGKKYVKTIYICDHLEGDAGRAYKDGFALAYIVKGYEGDGCPGIHTEETEEGYKALEQIILHELGHVNDLNNPNIAKKYDLEEYAYMNEPGNEHWKQQYDIWYDSLNEHQRGRIERLYYKYKINAKKVKRQKHCHPNLFIELNNPVHIPYGDKDSYGNRRVKPVKYIFYYVR